jgi:hypothetical protein
VYCLTACQRKDWKEHKVFCAARKKYMILASVFREHGPGTIVLKRLLIGYSTEIKETFGKELHVLDSVEFL